MAYFNFNKVILGGRLTAKPELKTTQSGVSVCTFCIAVNRKVKDAPTDFFNVTAWRKSAEIVAQYFDKGSSICVIGSIQNRTWTDKQNIKHLATDIVADEVSFVDGKQDSEPAYTPSTYAPAAPQLEEIQTSDDLPF